MKLSHSGMNTRVSTLGIILYPVIVHIAVQFEISWLAMAYISLLGTGIWLYCLWQRKWLVFISLTAVLMLLAYVWQQDKTDWFIFMPPVIIFAVLAGFFGRTLFNGRTALITNIARIMSTQSLSDAEVRYTKTITVIWTVFFCIMCVESVLLAVFAPLLVWSYMTNFINYLIVASMFVIEFSVRKRLIKQDSFNSFYHFISTMLKKRNEIRQKLL